MSRPPIRGAVFGLLAVLLPASAGAQVLKVAEMTAEQIRALDRATTVVILPGGILEQHGPHLPAFADGYLNQSHADALAAAIARRPGWRALVFPLIPLGSGGANEIAGSYAWPGTYAVRTDTLRAIFMDLAMELGEQGFRWVMVVHNHGSPWHNRALDQAGDFFRDTYGGRMVNLMGLEIDWAEVGRARAGLVPPEMRAEDADSVHAGLSETSRILHLRPDLVARDLKALPSVTAAPPAIAEAARAPRWPGYFGAPRHASAALGKVDHETAGRLWIAAALRVLDGADERAMPRYADTMLAIPPIAAIGTASQRDEDARRRRQEEWLSARAKARPLP